MFIIYIYTYIYMYWLWLWSYIRPLQAYIMEYIYIHLYIYRFVLFLQPLDYNSLKLDRHLADHSTRPIIALIAWWLYKADDQHGDQWRLSTAPTEAEEALAQEKDRSAFCSAMWCSHHTLWCSMRRKAMQARSRRVISSGISSRRNKFLEAAEVAG